jgi:hypothetical protein
MGAGRPTIYTPELAELICEKVATNTVGLEDLCRLFPELPNHDTIKRWRKEKQEFSALYHEAKVFQSRLLVEECEYLIPEVKTYVDDAGYERLDPASASLLKAKIEHRRWMAARLAPKIYGDKQQIEQTVTVKHEDALKELE